MMIGDSEFYKYKMVVLHTELATIVDILDSIPCNALTGEAIYPTPWLWGYLENLDTLFWNRWVTNAERVLANEIQHEDWWTATKSFFHWHSRRSQELIFAKTPIRVWHSVLTMMLFMIDGVLDDLGIESVARAFNDSELNPSDLFLQGEFNEFTLGFINNNRRLFSWAHKIRKG